MSFIGLIAEESRENSMRRNLLEQLKFKESSILCIKEKSIENIKNIKFETVLLAREFENVEMLKKLLENTKYLVINSDLKNNLNILDNLQLTVITYGFNSKATMTASSVTEDSMLLCLQRNVINREGKKIEPQEMEISIKENVMDEMGIASILLIYGKMMEK